MADGHVGAEDYSPLVERIRQVFAEVPYPGDDDIISTPEHRAVCDECSGLHESLAGRGWTELVEDDASGGEVGHAMSFYTPAGWQYYLPAYLIQHLQRRRFTSLDLRPTRNPELVAHQEERHRRLTAGQCRVVIAYLLIVHKEERSCRYEVERNREAVEHWKEVYRKALAGDRR